MMLRAFDRWMEERDLSIEIGTPYYSATLYRGMAPVLGVEAPALAPLVAETIRAADVAQRQTDERWALAPNQLALTFEELDRRLADEGRFLSVRIAPGGYDAFTTDWRGGQTTPAVVRPTLESAVAAALEEMPLPDVGGTAAVLEAPQRVDVPVIRPPARVPQLSESQIIRVLAEAGSITEAARVLGVSRSGLRGAMDRWQIPGPSRRKLTREQVERALQQAPSVMEASRMLDVPRATLRAAIERYGVDVTEVQLQREKERIERALQTYGATSRTARAMNISLRELRNAMARLGIEPPPREQESSR